MLKLEKSLNKYKVKIPYPSAERMLNNAVEVKISVEGGWDGGYNNYIYLPNKQKQVEFYMSNYIKPKRKTKNLDEKYFSVYITFSNSTRSRKEIIEVEPELVYDNSSNY